MEKSYSPKFKVGDIISGHGDSVVLKILRVEKVQYIVQLLMGNVKARAIIVDCKRDNWGMSYIDKEFKIAKKEYELLYG